LGEDFHLIAWFMEQIDDYVDLIRVESDGRYDAMSDADICMAVLEEKLVFLCGSEEEASKKLESIRFKK